MSVESDFWEWFEHGIKKGWISESCCYVHDVPPLEDDEMDEYWISGEICIPIVRVWGKTKVFDK